MIAIFESILPIFLVMLLGMALKRAPFVDQSVWPGLETLGYYLFFPMLLFVTLATADFSSLELGAVALAALIAVGVMATLALAIHPLAQARGLDNPRYTSLFQTATRWNAFIALAIAERLSGTTGLALVALVMAVIIIPLNLINVAMLVWYGSGTRSLSMLARRTVSNPLIIACVAGMMVNALPYGIYPPLEQGMNLIARAALGLNLLMVGAGLIVTDALRPSPAVLASTALKLVLFPLVMTAVALALGLTGEAAVILVLCAAVPTAMNGYVLARQMGGDTRLYAAAATVQTAASFLTIPAALWLAAAVFG
ncbi:AEC family transporter [Hoeflea olei]|uniref:Transporter n=1 Tax=Hoeflea olei TaxID=1480615 RepID=A0A1C1YTD7_9HYPH|nr:AEC family transporter [Hoeflea olei]OCW56716.1 transporter [Hoeflea olei]